MTRCSSDIVQRLRKASVYEEYKAILSNLGDEAADEIERLRAQVVSLQSSLDAGPRRSGKKTPDALEKPE